jgi:hypothetical protein
VCDRVDARDTELSRDSMPVPGAPSFFFFLKRRLRELLKELERDLRSPSSGISGLPNSSETHQQGLKQRGKQELRFPYDYQRWR